MNSKTGLFISFEGIDCSGKTTQCRLLENWMKENKVDAVFTREPGGVLGAERIRNIVLDKLLDLEPETELFLHMAARMENVRKRILPALRDGKHVVTDRFIDSTIAYQCYGNDIDMKSVCDVHRNFFEDLLPDITFVMDMDLELHTQRKTEKFELDRYESRNDDFYEDLIRGFKNVAGFSNDRCIVFIDASKSIEEIHQIIVEKIKEYITEDDK